MLLFLVGIAILNNVPFPTSECTEIVPCIFSISLLTISKPIPLPEIISSSFLVENPENKNC